jgi:hypothetical protein
MNSSMPTLAKFTIISQAHSYLRGKNCNTVNCDLAFICARINLKFPVMRGNNWLQGSGGNMWNLGGRNRRLEKTNAWGASQMLLSSTLNERQ